MEPAQDFSLMPLGTNPHCFEIITAKATYYVGESGAPGNGSSHQHGVDGLEHAKAWETAIRQALMPVILQSVQGQMPHSECLKQNATPSSSSFSPSNQGWPLELVSPEAI